jgi:Methyltransferase domain
MYVPPGHYYSPIPRLEDIERYSDSIFSPPPDELPGIDLDADAQLATVEALSAFEPAVRTYGLEPLEGMRYRWPNDFFPPSDAMMLHCLIGHLRPQRVVEIGSGYSSCVLLDAADHHLGGHLDCTLIEPFPGRLLSLVSPADLARVSLLRYPVQDVPLEYFTGLSAGDILFIDSSHVARVGGDLNHLLFAILPRLTSGVYVHLHDIPYPFEYPRVWANEGRAWNEAYFVRAFLQYNRAFRITLWGSYLFQKHYDRFVGYFPSCAEGCGPSLWLRSM